MEKQTGVMFVINSLHPGGAEHVLFNLAKGMVKAGKYRPVVACLKEAGELAHKFQGEGIAVHSNLLADKYDARVILRLGRIVADHGVRIVVPVGSGGDRMFWGTLAGKLSGARVVVWSHTFSQPGHAEFELSNRVIYPLVDRFVALGERHKACLAWRDKAPEGRITVIANGIEPHLNGSTLWRDRARAILGLADENIVAVAMIANLRDSKRHDVFIEAARRVVQQFRSVHFFIVGDGPNRERVKGLAHKSELLGRYLSLLGHRPDVSQLLPGFDLVCVCSEFQECQSLACLEAMSASVPVVSNVIGSMDEMILDNRTGFFYSKLTPEHLADKLLTVVPDVPLRRRAGAAARELVSRKFTCERLVGDFTGLFDSLLSNPNRQIGISAICKRI